MKEIERGTFLPVAHQKSQSELLAAGMVPSLQCALGNGETNQQRNLGGLCQRKVTGGRVHKSSKARTVQVCKASDEITHTDR